MARRCIISALILSTGCNSFATPVKCGTSSAGGYKNIRINNVRTSEQEYIHKDIQAEGSYFNSNTSSTQ